VPLPHGPDRPLGVATTNPAGNVSMNETLLSVVAPGLLNAKVSVVVPFSAIELAPNVLVIVGGVTADTVTVAFAVLAVPASTDVKVTVLFFTPAVVAVTLTLKVHEPFIASVPPLKLTLPLPATAVIVPLPHVPLRPLGVATTRPTGNVSVNATPVSA